MNQPAFESVAEDGIAAARETPRPRMFRVLTTGDVRDRHAPLLHNLPSRVAVEEVADIGAVLARLGEEPPPDLVVLGWTENVGDDTTALRRLHDHDNTVPLLIVQERQQATPSPNSEADAGSGRLTTIRDAIERLVTSIESLVAGAPAAPERTAAPVLAIEAAESSLTLRLDECRAMWRGQHVNLSLTEFRVVARLAADAGAEISHRELYDVIKSDGFLAGAGEQGYRGSVRATIKRIRAKFRQVDVAFDAIRSYPGFGYRWTANDGSGPDPNEHRGRPTVQSGEASAAAQAGDRRSG